MTRHFLFFEWNPTSQQEKVSANYLAPKVFTSSNTILYICHTLRGERAQRYYSSWKYYLHLAIYIFTWSSSHKVLKSLPKSENKRKKERKKCSRMGQEESTLINFLLVRFYFFIFCQLLRIWMCNMKFSMLTNILHCWMRFCLMKINYMIKKCF